MAALDSVDDAASMTMHYFRWCTCSIARSVVGALAVEQRYHGRQKQCQTNHIRAAKVPDYHCMQTQPELPACQGGQSSIFEID